LVTPPTRVNGKIQTVELIWQRLAARLLKRAFSPC
jgi:hypothetical protein